MKTENRKIEINYQLGPNWQDLSTDQIALIRAAKAAAAKAYAPYSNFNVGAALRLDSGTFVSGSNQENAAYPLCQCAEQVAIHSAFAQHDNFIIEGLAIYALSNQFDDVAMPCGACRQVLCESAERCKSDFPVITACDNGQWMRFKSVRDLLPLNFEGKFLR